MGLRVYDGDHTGDLRQTEEERRPDIERRLQPQTSTVALNDLLAGRQADAGAWVVGGRMGALEQREDADGILAADADAVMGLCTMREGIV